MSLVLRALSLHNWRSFVGDHELTLAASPFSNVTFIAGANGSGKTNLADAIEWAIYGTSNTQAPLMSRGCATTRVLITFSYRSHEFTLLRELQSAPNGDADISRVELTVDGRPTESTELTGSAFPSLPESWILRFDKLDASTQITSDLQQYLEFSGDRSLDALAEAATNYLRKLGWRHGYGRLAISDAHRVFPIDDNGNRFDAGASEQGLFVLSMKLALLDTISPMIPLVLESPFTLMDFSQRRQFAQSILTIKRQLILFAADFELDQFINFGHDKQLGLKIHVSHDGDHSNICVLR